MDKENLIFSIKENRDLFKPNLLVGKKLKTNRYKRIFNDKSIVKILKDESINETLDAFIRGSLNLTEASTKSYVHRNTLIYRINKVYKAIGLDFRKFEDCLIYLNMREIYKMVSGHDV